MENLLTTTRLMLKPLTSKELNEVFANHSKEEIMHELGYASDKEYEKQLKRYEENFDLGKRPFISFQMISKENGRTIGYCGFHNWVKEHYRAEIGYHVSRDEDKRQGFMYEAILAILEYGFSSLGLHRVEACTATDNTASINLLIKSGFKQEGIMRQHYFSDGVWYDSVLFSVLSSELRA